MFQNVSSGRSESVREALQLQSSLIETSADTLMDELFAELEQFDRGSLETRIVTTQATHPEPAPARSSTQVSTEFSDPQDDLDTLVAEFNVRPEQTEPLQFPHRFTKGQVWLGVLSVTLIAPLLLWVGSQIRSRSVPAVTATPQVTSTEVDGANAEFAAYVQRSLDSIEQKASVAPQPVTVPTPSSSTPTPSAPLEVVKLPERIYIPVYQPPQPQVTLKPQSPQVSKPATAKPVATAPLPAKTTTPTPAPVPTSAPAQTLVGILELGDRSAALIGSNGVTRRVRVGEILAPGGWTLAQVSDQKAILKRKGELRSIHVGQKF